MRARPITRIFALAIAVTGALAIPSAALAYTPGFGVSVTCTPSEIAVGDILDCVISVDAAGTTVTITIDSNTPTTPDTRTAVADASGQILFSYTAATAGVDRVSISGTRGGEAFDAFTLIDVLAPASVLGVGFDDPDGATGDEAQVLGIVLATETVDTEPEADVLAVIAIGVIAIGGGTLLSSRRRR